MKDSFKYIVFKDVSKNIQVFIKNQFSKESVIVADSL